MGLRIDDFRRAKAPEAPSSLISSLFLRVSAVRFPAPKILASRKDFTIQ